MADGEMSGAGRQIKSEVGGEDLALCPSLDSSLDQRKRELLANVHLSLGLASGALGGTHRPIQDRQTRIGARSTGQQAESGSGRAVETARLPPRGGVWTAQHDNIEASWRRLWPALSGNSCCICLLSSVHSCVSGRQTDSPGTLSPPGRVKEQGWYEHACPGPHTSWVPRYPEVDGT